MSLLLRFIYPKAIWELPTASSCVFVTFDDGPNPEITPWVLNLLESYKMKATFFCIGDNAVKHTKILNDIRSQGHGLGNHTQNHLNGFKTNTEDYLKNMNECALHIHSNLFRPPFGRMRRSQVRRIQRDQNFHLIMWSLLSRDYYPGLNTIRAMRRLKDGTKPGSIVVFHDSLKAESNLRILLPQYLDYLISEGFTSKAIVL